MVAFLEIDGQSISFEEGLAYLKLADEFLPVVQVILRQFVLEKAIKDKEQAFSLSSDMVDDWIVEFRLNNDLNDRESFENWLTEQNIDRSIFREQVRRLLQINQLKELSVASEVKTYFLEQKLFLDQVVLSRIVVPEKSLAEELKNQILEDGESFEKLAKAHSVTSERITNGMVGAVSRGSLPDQLRILIDAAEVGQIIGPIEHEDLWYLIRVDEVLSASLNTELEQQLKDQMFEQWLDAQIQEMDISLADDL